MRNPSARHKQGGLSLIETMVGLTVGLFIVGGALKLFIDNLDSNRRLLIETRVNQDLRAAADLIARDLRRASYWQNASSGVWQSAGPAPVSNPYSAIDASVANTITFQYDKTNPAAGFKLESGAIHMQVGTGWQELTDSKTMTVDVFQINEVLRPVCLLSSCVNPCPAGVSPCPPIPVCTPGTDPMLNIRQYEFLLRGHANVDARVVRQVDEIVRVRNDVLTGACPP